MNKADEISFRLIDFRKVISWAGLGRSWRSSIPEDEVGAAEGRRDGRGD
jgi:hypothetical protein